LYYLRLKFWSKKKFNTWWWGDDYWEAKTQRKKNRV
jgi:hypothetical protein